jgi:hypothetical protein
LEKDESKNQNMDDETNKHIVAMQKFKLEANIMKMMKEKKIIEFRELGSQFGKDGKRVIEGLI